MSGWVNARMRKGGEKLDTEDGREIRVAGEQEEGYQENKVSGKSKR
jgi:hypothetical protein